MAKFQPIQFTRDGAFCCEASKEEVFPLLCPKREEVWIPGWECETIWSLSGYNEAGAIFRTEKPYGTELYWNTLVYDIERGIVDFLIVAPRLFMFRFTIDVERRGGGTLGLTFKQVFTSVSVEGNSLIQRNQGEDFSGRLEKLRDFMVCHIEEKRKSNSGR